MKHLADWERKGAKKVNEERGSRNQTVEQDDLTCDWEGCGMVCKSWAGLVIHRKRMHEISKQKVTFTCEVCTEIFKQEANLLNHKKSCTGLKATDPSKKKCDKCMREYSKKYFSTHYKKCSVQPGSERPTVQATQYKSERAPCPRCGSLITKSNMSRHIRESCVMWCGSILHWIQGQTRPDLVGFWWN